MFIDEKGISENPTAPTLYQLSTNRATHSVLVGLLAKDTYDSQPPLPVKQAEQEQ